MRKITIEELNQMLLAEQSFKFKPTNKEIYKFITALCNLYGIYSPLHKNSFKLASKSMYVCVDKWNMSNTILATPVRIEDQNQEEIELILPETKYA